MIFDNYKGAQARQTAPYLIHYMLRWNWCQWPESPSTGSTWSCWPGCAICGVAGGMACPRPRPTRSD